MIIKISSKIKNQKGLTLIELLAVIVILGIIAAIAIPSIGNVIAKSKYDAAKSDAIQVLNAANLYISSSGTKSATISQDADSATSTIGSNAAISTNVLEDYLDPALPENLSAYTVDITNGKATIDASSKHPAKGETGTTKFVGSLSVVNAQQYNKHDNTPADTTD